MKLHEKIFLKNDKNGERIAKLRKNGRGREKISKTIEKGRKFAIILKDKNF